MPLIAEERERKPTDFCAFRIGLTSPETIRGWSRGEVTKPETINYRTFRPEKDGLFCERIFGPLKDWECSCGKYKRIRFRGVICDRCGVEVTQSKVRRERLGHIELAVPVSHIWYFKASPSRIGYLLDISVRDLERILYYESYVVIDPGPTDLKKRELLEEERYRELEETYGEDSFVAKMGAEGIRDLLQDIDVTELATQLRTQVKVETSIQRKKQTLKRLKVVEAFRISGNRPEWMILEVIPVLPPDLRPLVPLEGGRFATSDLNDLYRRVINRNHRLKKLMQLKAPDVILRHEKRMLQEAVDVLFDNGRRSRAVRGPTKRPLKSLSDSLKGKQGRFRQNLLGKRVDYSGRAVIVVGPELKLHQCGVPKIMALELFKPFIVKRLEDRGYVQTVKSAKRLIERQTPEVWDILEEITRDHCVLLNRAPTLHRLGIQAFQPVLVEGKAIRIHPLVCQAFNADFDGDQMAVHVPLSVEAQLESKILMLSVNNILSPAHGGPLAAATQDIVLGCYYLTKERPGEIGEGMVFASRDEVRRCFDGGKVGLHARVTVRIDDRLEQTTVGRVILNEIVPPELGYVNKTVDKSDLERLVAQAHRLVGAGGTAVFLDDLKEIGFRFATLSGLTVGVDDLLIPPEKGPILSGAAKEVEGILQKYSRGIITEGERYNLLIDTWTRANIEVGERMLQQLRTDRDGFNPVYMMYDSGARGSKDQIRQLAGMRGLMSKPQKRITGSVGEIIESPITSNLREGLNLLEYFLSTHGSRKGLADTALKTADAGYLTRRLVDVAQDVIVTEEDCGTPNGLNIEALKEGEQIVETLADRVLGRVALDAVRDPLSGETLVEAGQEIDEVTAERIEDAGIERVQIRSVLTCEARRGVCVKCYGRNLATGRLVELGEAVGVMAGQSIGEPGTQLTLRTFHIGGTAATIAAESRLQAKRGGSVRFDRLDVVTTGYDRTVAISNQGAILLLDEEDRPRARFSVPYGAVIMVSDGQAVQQGEVLFEWDPYSEPILTETAGRVRFVDVEKEETLREELDEATGKRLMVIIEDVNKALQPRVDIVDKSGKLMKMYPLATGSHLHVQDRQHVEAGTVLARLPKGISKTRDITGGLPRVAELFEARKPKDAAVVSDIDGVVRFGKTARGMRKIIVHQTDPTGGSGTQREYSIPYGKHLRVREGDAVKAGDKLCEGPVNPHDILRIKGAQKVQEYLVNEIQEVYRLQGVKINDKHIEVIVRQMLQQVRVTDPGDTTFLEGDQVAKTTFNDENDAAVREGRRAATFEPLLLGITRAGLSTESWVSAASFQETTRVLTEASIQGKRDDLRGLKENVIMGRLIPAGTGMVRYRDLVLEVDEEEPEPKTVILEPPEEGPAAAAG
jgi:DNA-directed RNA polymerase subunit beta'